MNGVHRSAISTAIDESIDALYQVLVEDLRYIRLPNGEEARLEARLFSENSDFPEIVWCSLDGTHVKV